MEEQIFKMTLSSANNERNMYIGAALRQCASVVYLLGCAVMVVAGAICDQECIFEHG